MIPDALRRIAREGIEYPARAIVRSSRADSQYTATVEVLDGAGEPTGQTLADVPLDPLWLAEDGSGVWAPPAVDQIVAVTWMGGEAGHPVITSGALMQAAAPRVPVEAGEFSIQGDTYEIRLKAGEVVIRDEAGTTFLRAQGERWQMNAPQESLYSLIDGILAQFRSLMLSLINSHINPSSFAFDTTSLTGFNAIISIIEDIEDRRLPNVLRP